MISTYNIVQELIELTVGEELLPHMIREFDRFEQFLVAIESLGGTVRKLKPTDMEDCLDHFAAITNTGHAVGYYAHDWAGDHGWGTMWTEKYINERGLCERGSDGNH